MRITDWRSWLYSDWGCSVLFHLLLVCVLVASVGFTLAPIPVDASAGAAPVVINASFVDPNITQAQYDKSQQEKAQRENAAREKAQRAAAERRRQEAQARRERAAAEQQRKADAAAAKQRELERQAAQALAKQRAEEERIAQAKAEQVAREAEQRAAEEAAAQALRDAVAAEQAAFAQAEQQRVLSEKQRYAALIKATIQRNLLTNDAFRGKSCRLNIRLGIGGVVLKVEQLSGHDALCRAAIAAVYKPSNLPVSRDPAVFAELKNINLTVEQ